MVTTKTVESPFKIQDGFAVPSKEPGLGVTPRLDVLGEPVASYC